MLFHFMITTQQYLQTMVHILIIGTIMRLNGCCLHCCCLRCCLYQCLYQCYCLLQARKLVQAAEAEDDMAGLPLPLLARAAGHWKARTQQQQHPKAPPTAAACLEEKPLTPLEELLGRGRLPPCSCILIVLVTLHANVYKPQGGTRTVLPAQTGRPAAHVIVLWPQA